MPERWQSELRRLRTVDMPPTLHDRIEAGPSGDRERSGRSRVVAAVVALGVFVAAGAFAWQAFRPTEGRDGAPAVADPADQVLVRLFPSEEFENYPAGTLTVGADTVEATIGNYSWCEPGGACGMTDIEIPEFDSYVPVVVGSELVVETDAVEVRVSLGGPAYPFADTTRLTAQDGVRTLDGSLGRHGLIVDVRWEDGQTSIEGQLYFPIELVEANVPTPTPSEVEPVPSPEPTSSAMPVAWWDVESELPGVGAVCGATSVDGTFSLSAGDEPATRAWVFEPEPEGGCDGNKEDFQFVGLEDATGEVRVVSDELRDCLDSDPCWAFSAPDVDGDGFQEIAVGSSHEGDAVSFTLHRVYECPSSAPCLPKVGLEPFEIAEPGDPHEGFPPGPVRFRWGGTPEAPAGAQGIACKPYEDGHALVYWFTATYDQWMIVNGSQLELVGADDLSPSEERVDSFCGAPIFDVV